MTQQQFSIKQRIKSFGFALTGLKTVIKEEHNSRIHIIAVFCVALAGIYLKISVIEWIAISFASGLVIALEVINSSIECIADFISPEKHESIKKIKDISAAGVLVGAITALIIGMFVFLPKIIQLC